MSVADGLWTFTSTVGDYDAMLVDFIKLRDGEVSSAQQEAAKEG